MQETTQIPHKKLCLTCFIVAALILTVFYYDNNILNYAVPYAAEEIAFVEVRTESIDYKPIVPKTAEILRDSPSNLIWVTIPNNTSSTKSTKNNETKTSTDNAASANARSTKTATSVTTISSSSTISTSTSTFSNIITASVTNLKTSTTSSSTNSTVTPINTTSNIDVSDNNNVTDKIVNGFIDQSISTTVHSTSIGINATDDTSSTNSSETEYLVSSTKCKIPNLNPFNSEALRYHRKRKYKSCRSKKLLTYVTVTDNIATLHVDASRVPSYSNNGVTCCYSNVTRVKYDHDPDSKIKYSTCRYFKSNITISKDPAFVKCLDVKSRKQLYENVHAPIVIDKEIEKKFQTFDNNTNPFSVLFVGIDSISRLNFIRSMPKTHKFVEENGWIPLKGYNKMDDNTFPNLMAILTGFNNSRSYEVCQPRKVGALDKCPMVWYDYRKLGYVTGYAEDSGGINTFNYRKKGFKVPPVDYYYRPYVLASEKLGKSGGTSMPYCTGPETAGERIMNAAKDFAVTFKNYSSFGFFWMNSFSHNDVNMPSSMDDKVKAFLEDITDGGVTNKSIVIFLSDHGMRFGSIRLTDTGWLEERLPYIYVSFPKWFIESFPKEYNNFKINTNRLTTPYDLHMTLKHILVLSGREYKMTNSEACPNCKSLFEEAEEDRSCSEAGIVQHWCTCAGYKNAKFDTKVQNRLGTFMLGVIHDIIRSKNNNHSCAKYTLDKLIETRVSQNSFPNNSSYILVQLRTKPTAIFESTVRYSGDINTSQLYLSGDISRLDSYDKHSKCVNGDYLRKYCYCSSTGEKV